MFKRIIKTIVRIIKCAVRRIFGKVERYKVGVAPRLRKEPSPYEEFVKDWYAYEEAYACNFFVS